ncbi:MAG: hypothetical protein HUU32_10420 [Calditrichaceae bacterium]|nr:hypothetical protein [Calditrichia bacterium]NUQ41797.1 hypothetical protein [Calditrichaceae bacterium]
MRLNAPKKMVWMISVILGAVGVVGQVAGIGVLMPYTFWLVTVALALLALGNVMKGM